MMNTMTIVVLVIFLVFIALGFARGLIKSVFKIVLAVLALLLAYFLSPIVSDVIIENTDLDNSIRNKIYTAIETRIEQKVKAEMSQTLGEMNDELASQLANQYLEEEPNRNKQIEFIQDLELPEFLQTALIDNNHFEMKQEMGVSNFYDYISTYLARMIVNAIVFFGVFLVLSLLFNLTLLLMNMVMKLPGLNMINRLGGAAFGFVEALLIIWVLFVILDLLVSTELGGELVNQIRANEMLSLLYDKNIISQFIENLIKGI